MLTRRALFTLPIKAALVVASAPLFKHYFGSRLELSFSEIAERSLRGYAASVAENVTAHNALLAELQRRQG